MRAVEGHNSRRFTNEGDIIAAFHGLLDRSRVGTPSKYIFNLSVNELHEAFLWSPAERHGISVVKSDETREGLLHPGAGPAGECRFGMDSAWERYPGQHGLQTIGASHWLSCCGIRSPYWWSAQDFPRSPLAILRQATKRTPRLFRITSIPAKRTYGSIA